jgi:hypothetical protein
MPGLANRRYLWAPSLGPVAADLRLEGAPLGM